MGILDWIKVRQRADRKVGDSGALNAEISPLWQPGPYKVESSGFLVQPNVGWSDKGYHPGLTILPPKGKAETHWGSAVPDKRQALVEANSAFSGWIEAHEAETDAKERRKNNNVKNRRETPSWER
jgi:hypothetical protein